MAPSEVDGPVRAAITCIASAAPIQVAAASTWRVSSNWFTRILGPRSSLAAASD
jgi:hypothetical protein